jgi:hypothetical protein
VTDIAVDRGFGQASTRFCKVSVITSPTGLVQQLDTEDSNAGYALPGAIGVYGSICGQQLGMKPQSQFLLVIRYNPAANGRSFGEIWSCPAS